MRKIMLSQAALPQAALAQTASMARHRPLAIAILGLAMLGLPAAGFAQDAKLYADAVNPDAGYLRVIMPGKSSAIVAGDSFSELDDGVSPYVMIDTPGTIAVSAGAAQGEAEVGKGSWNTYLITASGEGHMVTDPLTHSPAQADVTFYNISDLDDVDLYVPAAKRAAMTDIDTGTGEWIALKAPLSLEFQVRHGEDVLASVADVALVRREGTTLVFRGQSGRYELVALKAATKAN
ncbi:MULTISPECIES: hypothetical protein [Thioclava]|uniref:Alginate biosynthesis protein AlgF n=1 Tax=Thioclava litoralis TaxID=3076557 RepID=A0ABZ1E173_9RHOB|nr:hypothetical protein RPE78_12870 [Thioclava sp. FTW29]